MKLGGPLFQKFSDPESWAAAAKAAGYSACYCPVGPEADDATVAAYAEAARRHGIVIAEVGVWNNPLDADASARKRARERCQVCLALADRIGARCCVNIAGSRGAKWDGPDPLNLTEETFGMIVECTRLIIDAVKPTRTFYTLEPMPWMFPDSAESYLRLIKAIDRRAFAVHFDPVNLVNSPTRYFNTGALIQDCLAKLGPHLRSCHAKDIIMRDKLTLHLDEVRPGLGALDYGVYLHELDRLDPEIPLMLEHLSGAEEYALAAEHIRATARREGIRLA